MLHRLVILWPFKSQSELTLIDPGCAMSYRVPVAAVGRYSEFKSRTLCVSFAS
jgi:hypothetical protein